MLDAAAQARPDDTAAQSAMHFGRGELAMAQKKPVDALTHFQACAVEDDMARWRALEAANAAGDTAAAASARETLLRVYQRDPRHLLIRARLAGPARTT